MMKIFIQINPLRLTKTKGKKRKYQNLEKPELKTINPIRSIEFSEKRQRKIFQRSSFK